MAKDEQAAIGPEPTLIDAALRKEFDAIAREDTPVRLLELAREVLRLTRPKTD